MTGVPRRALSLRATLLVLIVLAAAYIAAFAAWVANVIGPRARALGAHSRQVLTAYTGIQTRDAVLDTLVADVHGFVARAQVPGAKPDTAAAHWLSRRVSEEIDRGAVVRTSTDLLGIPTAMRAALAEAATRQSEVGSTALEALALVEVGRSREAAAWLMRLDVAKQEADADIGAAQRLGLDDIIAREQSLGDESAAVATAIAWWALAGVLLLPVAAAIVHRRLYRPLAALDGAFARLSRGEGDVTVPVARADELGRLAEHFNRMADVLRSRADEERRQSEAAIRVSDLQLRAVWDNTAEGLRLCDENGIVVRANDAYCRMFGLPRSEIEGRLLSVVYDPARAQRILERHRERMRTQKVRTQYQAQVTLWNGRRMWLEVSTSAFEAPGQPPLLLSVLRDVTERRHLEEQLRQSQKMDAVGRLAGGIAHDFNNILSAILAYAELARTALPDDDPVRDDVAQIEAAARRAADLTRQLLAFARRQMLELRVVDVNELVANIQNLLQRLLGEQVALETRGTSQPALVKVDPGQFEQVLVNLAVNARDAMPGGGRLTIGIANVAVNGAGAVAHPDVTPGDWVLLSVTDTGSGMSEDVQRRIFEPFFTTKERGKGTGLGLATCYGIVRQAGGHIFAESRVGRGSTFRVYVPRSDEPLAARPVVVPAPPLPTGSETILLVEDEDLLRDAVARALREQGYTVLGARSGEEALDLAAAHDGPVDLLLTDVVLPGMSGRDVADRLLAEQPQARVLYVSGYAEDAVVHHGALDAGIEFLPKPFTPAVLAKRVRDVLAAP